METKPICNKTYFTDEKAADEYLFKLHNTSVRKRIPIRSYYCDKCGFWHLTSQKDRLKEKVKELELEKERLKKEVEDLKKEEQIKLNKECWIDERLKKMNETLSTKQKIIREQQTEIGRLVSKINTPSMKIIAHTEYWDAHYNIYFNLLDNDNIIGSIRLSCRDDIREIQALYVDDRYRNKGYAKMLMEHLLDYCRFNNEKKIWLLVRKDNNIAIGMYKKYGFKYSKEKAVDMNGFKYKWMYKKNKTITK